jgi:hypothetical protein
MPKRLTSRLALLSVGLVALLLAAGGTASGAPGALAEQHWEDAATPGFGDRQNSIAWSMRWWRGKLYVGTGRSYICWRGAMWATLFPGLASSLYPPRHADADCPPSPTDLPMQAEIWRWTPETDTWERVYQSPQDVPIPGYPGKSVARDIGYRGMLVFTEADGAEALYVPAVSAREMYTPTEQLPPPRLLRTTDGVTFEPVPQAPGTFLGDLPLTGLRSGAIYNGRMYLTNGTARGEGTLIEAQNPAAGDDSFREVMAPGTTVWDVVSYNGFLYVGTATPSGFAVLKTDARGSPPYTFTTVITAGGYLNNPSPSVVSFQEFAGRLYVGTYLPAELYRLNPDDTWDLIVGRARQTPAGMKNPLSGLEPGFGWPYNVQIYRMHVHDGALYLGTLDTSREVTEAQPGPVLDLLLRWHYGFDLYRTVDGEFFEPVTINGFGDGFQVGVRTFETTPYGMFLGASNYWYGFRLWRMWSETKLYLPMIAAADSK